MHKSKYFIVPINVKCQAVGLPADSRWVGLQEEATQELNEGFLVCKLVKLTNQGHAQLILLASNTVTCSEQKRYNTGSQPPWMLENFWYPVYLQNECYIYCTGKYIWKLKTHHLCLSPCPPFCSFYRKICSVRFAMLPFGQCYQSRLLKRMKRWSWPAPCCHKGHRRAVAIALEKHPHLPGNWPGARNTKPLDRRTHTHTKGQEQKKTHIRMNAHKGCFLTVKEMFYETYNHLSYRTSASWLSFAWQFPHKPLDVPSSPLKKRLKEKIN